MIKVEKAKNNFTIEMRIFENYEKVKYEIIKVIDFLRHAETNLGMCRIFDNQNHELWHSVIKPWFQPEMVLPISGFLPDLVS